MRLFYLNVNRISTLHTPNLAIYVPLNIAIYNKSSLIP